MNGAGAFARRAWTVAIGRPLLAAIIGEWSAQIARLTQCGVPISHIDSHHHVHTRPALFVALKTVQARTRIRTVRISDNLFPKTRRPEALGPYRQHRPSAARCYGKGVWNHALRYIVRTRTTEYYGDLQSFLENHDALRPSTTVEIGVHPGNAHYPHDTDMLNGDHWQQVVGRCRLITYRQV